MIVKSASNSDIEFGFNMASAVANSSIQISNCKMAIMQGILDYYQVNQGGIMVPPIPEPAKLLIEKTLITAMTPAMISSFTDATDCTKDKIDTMRKEMDEYISKMDSSGGSKGTARSKAGTTSAKYKAKTDLILAKFVAQCAATLTSAQLDSLADSFKDNTASMVGFVDDYRKTLVEIVDAESFKIPWSKNESK